MELQGSRQLWSKNNLELHAVLNGLQIKVPLTEASLLDHINCNDQAKKCFLHHTNIHVKDTSSIDTYDLSIRNLSDPTYLSKN